MNKNYDVIVVGAGHAGVEAALAASRLGLKTALFTIYLDNIAMMSCNPSIGGPGKSHLVSELGMLGGEIARHIDNYNLQLKNLNHTKGLASRITRAQADKYRYRIKMREVLEKQENLDIIQGIVADLMLENGEIRGVEDKLGVKYGAKAVILCTGTFLKGQFIIGDVKYSAGRQGEPSSDELPDKLAEYGFELDRYQTATPPRIDKRTIDFSKTQELKGEEKPRYFSYETEKEYNPVLPTWLTFTTEKTIETGKEMLKYSPIVTGIVSTKGPRHCPSLDRKILNFPEKTDHQIFLEQESVESNEIYVNGFTTAMPPFAQEAMLKTIAGLENAKILRYGYAVEYNFIPAYQLNLTLETKVIKGLYTAGTINGTSGYEEAACQGFIAGVNAARRILGKEEIVIDRSEGYIGVLIDDIINKKTPEPYRVLPSRAEYRLTLRQDNIFIRLLEKSKEIGLLSKKKLEELEKAKNQIDEETERLKTITVYPTKETNEKLKELGKIFNQKNNNEEKTVNSTNSPVSAFEFLARKEIIYDNLSEFIETKEFSPIVKEQIEINAKYNVFIEREKTQIEKFKKLEEMKIPENIDYEKIRGLSNIAVSGLTYGKPHTVGQASRISGVTYNDIGILIANISSFLEKK
ncbi:tRNA uridine-5-carboxymethylaminomethyl(34) synthesis enzyme MnmG [Pseudoleptotrichia goodfellowii]|uniref:tRNA uridine 5-carboxymethylaminomethyl modification enzyme MnmG n=1 Tax=Pseudoleptotrichia goodfellowii TaxID=157692 RepID=A0A510JDL4_9FUSO|nr:tRNA uridine-5-carboxymethylaminomethyl(34) synthesis enzyme MnmG [Pseudoleptotrichia goodfellowii]BBM37314.1 tRNA uridine 5-carboxymethylaminomethylmodification protein GidA [Pseudoleptotrichia goodfellowii]